VYLMQNRHSRKLAWAWLKNNWGWIEKNFATDKSYDHYPRYTASAFATDEWLKEYKAFYDPMKDIPALTRNIALGEAEIKQKAAWTKRDHKKLATWLSKS
jgi:aminopeptidase N